MRGREEITKDMVLAARPSEMDKYVLRLLKAELLTVELLMDVRDLLVGIQGNTRNVVVDFVPPDYGKES